MYQQKTRAQAPTASGADFGSGAGQALSQQGDVLAQIGDRIMLRNETINRVRVMNQFEQQVQEDFATLQQSEDISDTDAIEAFRNTIRERREAALSSFSGRPGTREAFRSQLENMEGQYVKNAIGEQIKAQNQVIAVEGNKIVKSAADLVSETPELFDDIIEVKREELKLLSPGMTTAQEDAALYKLREQAAVSAIQTTLQRGFGDDENTEQRISDFEKFLDRPDVSEVIPRDVRLTARADISKVRYDRDQKVKNYTRNVQTMQNLGVDVTPEIAAMIPSERIEPLESLNLYQALTENKPSDAMIASAFGIKIPDGGSLTPTQKDEIYLMGNINAFANGQLNPQEAMNFQRVFGKIYGGKVQQDGFGKLYTVGNYVPPALQQKYTQGLTSYGYSEPQTGSPTLSQINNGGTPPPSPTIRPDGKVGYTPRYTGMGGIQEGKITGFFPALLSAGSKIAGAAGFGSIAPPELEAYRTKFRLEQKNIITASQNNNKFPEGERKALADILNIEPAILDSPQMAVQRMVVMNDSLVEKLYDYRVAIETKSVPTDVVEAYAEMAPLLKRFIRFVNAGETDVRVGGLYMGDLDYPQVIQQVGKDKETGQKVIMLEDGSVHPVTHETNLKDL